MNPRGVLTGPTNVTVGDAFVLLYTVVADLLGTRYNTLAAPIWTRLYALPVPLALVLINSTDNIYMNGNSQWAVQATISTPGFYTVEVTGPAVTTAASGCRSSKAGLDAKVPDPCG